MSNLFNIYLFLAFGLEEVACGTQPYLGGNQMSARETRQKYIQEWKGSSFAFHYSPACVALLVNLVLSLLFFTVDCELSLLSAKNKCSGELHAPRKTRRTRDSRRAPNIRLKNIYRCVLRVLCPSGLVRSVYFTRSLIFSRCWRLRAVYFLPLRLILLDCFHLNV